MGLAYYICLLIAFFLIFLLLSLLGIIAVCRKKICPGLFIGAFAFLISFLLLLFLPVTLTLIESLH